MFHDVLFFFVGYIKVVDKAARKSKIVKLNLPGVLNVLMSNLSTVLITFINFSGVLFLVTC